MRIIATAALAALLSACGGSGGDPAAAPAPPSGAGSFAVTQLEAATVSGITRPRTAVATDQAGWASLWAEHKSGQPLPPRPAVDFSHETAAGIFTGDGSACSSVRLVGIVEARPAGAVSTVARVDWRLVVGGGPCIALVTQPSLVFKFDNPARLPVEFNRLADEQLAAQVPPAASDEVVVAGTRFRFASQAQAAEALSADDEWTRTAGDFQRAATLGSSSPVSREQLRVGMSAAALAWTAAGRARWEAALREIAPKLETLRLRLPTTVTLASTQGWEQGNAPYTRGQAIFLPADFKRSKTDAQLLAHELFHVYSRANPDVADAVHALFGYQRTEPLEWPAEWDAVRISNPDAPYHRSYVTLDMGNGPVRYTPVLVAATTTLKPGQTFFDVMEERLLAVEPGRDGAATRALRSDGRLVWVPLNGAYFERLYSAAGRNTPNLLHPEETAADHFSLLVGGDSFGFEARDKALVERVGSVLLQARGPR